jgi:hypothetical protein
LELGICLGFGIWDFAADQGRGDKKSIDVLRGD